VIGPLEGAGGAAKRQAAGLEVQLQAVLGHIGDGNGEVDKVLLGLGG
jgi:hypothetical protein